MYRSKIIIYKVLIAIPILAASCSNGQVVVSQEPKGSEVIVKFSHYDILHLRPDYSYVQDALKQHEKMFLPDSVAKHLFEYAESIRRGEPYRTTTTDSSSYVFTDYPDLSLTYMRNDTVLLSVNETVGKRQGYERREYTSRFHSFCLSVEKYLELYTQRVNAPDFYQLANALFPRDLFPWYEGNGQEVRKKYIGNELGEKLFLSTPIYLVDIKLPDGGLEMVVTKDTLLNYPLYTIQDFILPSEKYPIKRDSLFVDSDNLSAHQIVRWLSALYPKGVGYITKATRSNKEFFYNREIFLLKSYVQQ